MVNFPGHEELTRALDDAIRQQKAEREPTTKYKNEQLYTETDWENKIVRIAICGSQIRDVRDWTQNFSTFWQRRIGRTKYKATYGYVKAAENLMKAVDRFAIIPNGFEVKISGHSKGAGQACPFALLLAEAGYKVLEPPRRFASPRFSMQYFSDPLVTRSINYATRTDYVPNWPEPWIWRNWKDHGVKVIIGKEVNEHWGVVRDAAQAHYIENYIEALEMELENL